MESTFLSIQSPLTSGWLQQLSEVMGLYGQTQNTEILGGTFTYTLQSEFDPLLAVILWGLLGPLNAFCAFTYWYWFQNSIIDTISFFANAGLFGQNFLAFLIVLVSLDSEGSRALYYWSSMIASLGPFVLWPATFVGYLVHAILYVPSYSSYSYMVVKILLFFIYDLVISFMALETLFPIYNWWQILATLADKVPYVRPTPEEVEAADRLENFVVNF